MKIGIIGVGHIGKTLARELSRAGHDVKVANSRGPETIDAEVLVTGARAVTAGEAVADVEAIILSVPMNRIPGLASLIGTVPEQTVVIDTSNYFPGRDDRVEPIEAGQVESLWVAEQLGRPIAKAWNAIGSDSLAKDGRPAGSPERIALPIAADRARDREVAMKLVEDTGLTAYDAGGLADSWRQQPGAPAYCTGLTYDEIGSALAAADKSRLPVRRDLMVQVLIERMGDPKSNPDADYGVRLARILFM